MDSGAVFALSFLAEGAGIEPAQPGGWPPGSNRAPCLSVTLPWRKVEESNPYPLGTPGFKPGLSPCSAPSEYVAEARGVEPLRRFRSTLFESAAVANRLAPPQSSDGCVSIDTGRRRCVSPDTPRPDEYLAEGRGFEPLQPEGRPQLSKLAHSRSVSLPQIWLRW